ncbi:hypothetical protein KIL84_009928 [Mauremys mutica]|uniref:Ig-like domain-containing protein n=1 Tax=Mauremys mutica TaxID=74926 RepID=A0A9D4B6M4_9SAUR|nr:hypothetical protein KIL84_009928 [Mauremys mutica]
MLRESIKPKVEVLYSCTTNPGTVQLVCLISGFNPKPLTVQWMVAGKPSGAATTTEEADGHTFSVSESEWLEGKTYTCEVSQTGTTPMQAHAHKCGGDARRR